MKIFQQLMLAPVAVGLIAPSATAAELNMSGVNQYASSEQVVSVTQFSDVRPTDWAYQALSNLVDRYGCVAGYPDGTYRGGRAMTRYEAAALLNVCLDRVTEVTEELDRLISEFEVELAILKGRVDGIESKVIELEVTQFSTTTKLNGEATFVLGGVPDLKLNNGENVGNTAFNYDVSLNFDTSFTGNDLLRTRLRAGNFSAAPFGSDSSLFKLDDAEMTGSDVVLDRLYYQFPVGSDATVTVGPKVSNTEMTWIPSVYESGILDFFTTAGAPGVYNKATGAGVGVQYEKSGFVAGVNYIAQNGDDTTTGVFDADGALNVLAQLGYRQDNWGVGVGYRYGTAGTRPLSYNGFLGANGTLIDGQDSNSVSASAYWRPSESRLVPSISVGYGYNDVSAATENVYVISRIANVGKVGNSDTTNQSWFVGLQWDDAFITGNAAGVAVGQPANEESIDKDALMLELFYKAQITDNISITPAVFYISNNQSYQDSSNWGGVIQTKFKF
jgi:hypothetical protein